MQSVPGPRAAETIERLQGETKRLAHELEQLKMKVALGAQSGDDAITLGDARLIARRVSGLEKGSPRGLADSLRDRLGRGGVVLASENEGKVALVGASEAAGYVAGETLIAGGGDVLL